MILKSIIDFFSSGLGKILAGLLLVAGLFFWFENWKTNLLEECQRTTRLQVEVETQKKKDEWIAIELEKFNERLKNERKVWDKEHEDSLARKDYKESMNKVESDVQKEIETVVKIIPCNNVGNDFVRLLNKAQGTVD